MTSANVKHSNNVTAIILAAGKGSRFNGHKMMHDINGIPMAIQSALNAKPHVDNVLLIVRPKDKTLKIALKEYNLPYLENPDFESGMSSSIVTAINHIPVDQNILLCLGDMPFIRPDTYRTLIESFMANEAKKIVRPIFSLEHSDAIPAHPVLFPAFLQPDLKKLKGDEGAKSILKTHKPVLVKTYDEGVIKDIDFV